MCDGIYETEHEAVGVMETNGNQRLYFVYSMVATVAVYVFAHWDGLTDRYVIMDDVRQQIFWMQQWLDPALFQNDLLTKYSKNYVPWSVKAIYWAGSFWMNPVQFTKVVAGILFLANAGFLFGLALAFRDDLTPVFVVCIYLFLGGFMRKISGGLSMGFAFPLLTGYLFYLSRNNLVGAGIAAFLAALFTPYTFLVCLGTHVFFLAHLHWGIIRGWLTGFCARLGIRGLESCCNPETSDRTPSAGSEAHPGLRSSLSPIPRSREVAGIALMASGCLVMALQYVFVDWSAFGKLITWNDMVGKIEYTDVGRYELFPIPSLFYELARPWIFNLPYIQWGILAGWIFVAIGVVVFVYAFHRAKWDVDLSGFRVFAYLFPASLILYVLASIFIFRLFVPRRYVEFSLNIFYCVACGVTLKVVICSLVSRRVAFPLVTTLLVIIAALRLNHEGLFDYSEHARLYGMLGSTPRSSLLAGHPNLMDDVVTFGRRKAFVTYKLSHTWYKDYWATIKQRTFDFFRAYYAADPEEIHEFCRANGIDYLLVRDDDFRPQKLRNGKIYFEPFNSYVRELTKDRMAVEEKESSGSEPAPKRPQFAILDAKAFPPVFIMDGVRVIKCR